MKTERWGATLLIAIVATASPTLADSPKQVHCEKGQTLTKALEKTKPGDTFLVSGTCRERVVITTDQITLGGQGQAILDGGGGPPIELSGVITVDGARGVVIRGFTIQNGPGEGILSQRRRPSRCAIRPCRTAPIRASPSREAPPPS